MSAQLVDTIATLMPLVPIMLDPSVVNAIRVIVVMEHLVQVSLFVQFFMIPLCTLDLNVMEM